VCSAGDQSHKIHRKHAQEGKERECEAGGEKMTTKRDERWCIEW
jgi:hypothetical protein